MADFAVPASELARVSNLLKLAGVDFGDDERRAMKAIRFTGPIGGTAADMMRLVEAAEGSAKSIPGLLCHWIEDVASCRQRIVSLRTAVTQTPQNPLPWHEEARIRYTGKDCYHATPADWDREVAQQRAFVDALHTRKTLAEIQETISMELRLTFTTDEIVEMAKAEAQVQGVDPQPFLDRFAGKRPKRKKMKETT